MKATYKTIAQVRRAFWENHPEFKSEYRKTYTQNQYRTDIRVTFCDFIEVLSRDGLITPKMAQKITL